MRLIIFWIAFLQMGGCVQNNKVQDETNHLVYEASSRGYFYRIEINQQSIKVLQDRAMEQSSQRELKPKEWQALLELIEKIDLKSIDNLEVSTELSASDRSAIATVSIRKGIRDYESPSFDANSPPMALKSLITQMLALAETVE